MAPVLHPIHHFILDFYCHAYQLVIEVEGEIHGQRRDYDTVRTEWLIDRDFKVIRFTNDEVLKNIDAVLKKIAVACDLVE